MGSGGGAALLIAELASVATLTLCGREGIDFLAHSRGLAVEEGEAARERALILGTFEAMAIAQEGRPRRSLEMARELAADAMAGGHVLAFGYAIFSSGVASMLLGRFAETEAALNSVLHTITDDMGLMWGAASGWSLYSQVLFYQGRMDEAWDAVLRAEEISRRHATMMLPMPMVNGAMLLATRGETAAARERLAEARALMARGCTPVYETWYWAGLALTAEAEERAEEALAAYEAMWATAQRFHNAGVAVALRPGQVLALVECGRAAEAVGVAREVVESLEQPDAPSGLAHALGALAVALAASGEVIEALTAAERAVAHAEDLEGARPRALAFATAGAALQRLGAGARAAAVLRLALDGFVSMGWRPRVEHIRRLLAGCEQAGGVDGAAAATERRAAGFSLRERQVIELATAGLSTRSIALRLTLSERTVENHLARIYAKLEVHSRAELIAHMARVASAAE
jgi:DNA-binding CsgD family transcriptional regulator